ncbi:MAG: hypothetical protein D6795_09820 [Deltaproteobacteria bacterium]|nr:MAG: hypothetical protein D6795_09820 [Deltaproteobacteria bacterium]
MPKTAKSAEYVMGTDADGNSALIMGDIASHVFDIIWPQTSREMAQSATSDTDVIPNSCNACHDRYAFSGD